MVRTFIQITALSLVLISSFFLLKGVISLSAQDMIKLSQTTYGGTYMRMVKNLTQQKSDTIVGFVLLLASFFLSLINFLWPMRWVDFGVNSNGVILAVLISIVIFLGAYKASNVLQQHYYKQAEKILEKPKDENNK
jgi:hypothetical protein